MKRRQFITLLGGASVVWPLAASAQQAAKLPTIGCLDGATPAADGQRVASFVQQLHELGWNEGRNVKIEYRWAEGRRFNTLVLTARLPAIYNSREWVEAGGLMSYGSNFLDLFRRAAGYVDKILRGAKAGDIPVEQPTKFDLVINLTTAKALGLSIPESFLVRADGVIE
jgi:ABC transporter substrate binding protein